MMAKEELPECPVATAVALIGGKWKLLIIRNLRVRPWRFNELRRNLEGISQKVLTDSLRQMEDDGLVFRHDYGENPPRVEYGLTELGRQMMPIMDSLADFGAYYKTIVSKRVFRLGMRPKTWVSVQAARVRYGYSVSVEPSYVSPRRGRGNASF